MRDDVPPGSRAEWNGIFVLHGSRRDDEPGTDAYAAIYRRGACPESAAQTSAMVLDLPGAKSIGRRQGA